MISQRFRIKTPLIVIIEVNGLYTSTQAAVGEIVTVTNGPLDGVRMVEVQWRDKTALMFTIELRTGRTNRGSRRLGQFRQLPARYRRAWESRCCVPRRAQFDA